MLTLKASTKQQNQLRAYVALLEKWNKSFNLTRVTDIETRHVLESLTISPFLWGDKIIDVGTGAGLPGVPLAIMHPDKQFYLLDSNQKRQVFIKQVIHDLELSNCTAVHARVQAYQPVEKFSTILTRAFAPLPKIIPLCSHLMANEGKLLAMIGKPPADLFVGQGYNIQEIRALHVPAQTAQRHLAVIVKE